MPGHETLFPKLIGKLTDGGRLAVQMPDNLDEPVHRFMRQVAEEGPWREKLRGAARTERFKAEWYHSLLNAEAALHCGRYLAHDASPSVGRRQVIE